MSLVFIRFIFIEVSSIPNHCLFTIFKSFKRSPFHDQSLGIRSISDRRFQLRQKIVSRPEQLCTCPSENRKLSPGRKECGEKMAKRNKRETHSRPASQKNSNDESKRNKLDHKNLKHPEFVPITCSSVAIKSVSSKCLVILLP